MKNGSLRNYKYGFLIVSLLLIISGCSSSGNIAAEKEYHFIRFQKIGNRIPVIKVRLNDREAWFIVDTGASYSLLNISEMEHFGFSTGIHQKAGRNHVKGLGGKLALYDTFRCEVELGNLAIKYIQWKSGDISELCSTIRQNENIRIAGIIGSDLLLKYGININFEERTLSWKNR